MSESHPHKPAPANSFRITLTILSAKPRIDSVLLEELRKQSRNIFLKSISRADFKELFKKKRVLIKGQPATPSSGLAAGSTDVDILGYAESTES